MICCYSFENLLKRDNFHISYHAITRRYRLRIPGSGSHQRLFFCFFCGKKFPPRLIDEWKETVKKECKIEDPWEALYDETLPEEFMTDAWWKKRGL